MKSTGGKLNKVNNHLITDGYAGTEREIPSKVNSINHRRKIIQSSVIAGIKNKINHARRHFLKVKSMVSKFCAVEWKVLKWMLKKARSSL